MSALLIAVAEAARAYCERVAELTPTRHEMTERGAGVYARRYQDARRQREDAYVVLHRALCAAGYTPARPAEDESVLGMRRRTEATS